MGLSIQLLGAPTVSRDGTALDPPRGRKVWALLAYLVFAERPPSRRELTDRLFPDSEDPKRALRWNLTELRRLLRPDGEVGGEPVVLSLAADAEVDVRALRLCMPAAALEHPGLGRELLEGVEPRGAPAFETWLLSARHSEQVVAAAILREGVGVCLDAGDAARAVERARRLVALEPLDEDANVWLVRSYVAAGDDRAAQEQVAAYTELSQRELKVPPTHALTEALGDPFATPARRHITGAVEVETRLEAGETAMQAGLTDAGLAAFRGALRTAREMGESRLELRAGAALGAALVHTGRGTHALGRVFLSDLATQAMRTEAVELLASMRCDLAWADILDGHYDAAAQHLRAAQSLTDDPAVCARVELFTGWILCDTAHYEEALVAFERSSSAAAAANSASLTAWAAAMIGRVHLLREEVCAASAAIEESRAAAARAQLRVLRSVGDKLMGSLALRRGDLPMARQALEHAYALAHQSGDVTMLAGSARGLALVDLHRADGDAAIDRLVRARSWLARTRDYQWQAAWVLDTLCGLGISQHVPRAQSWVDELGRIAKRTNAREFLARADVHRYRLTGDDRALEAARSVAATVGNPSLAHLVDHARAGHELIGA